ncbi:hypothetical protein GGS21DRAFT_549024 [Xylaria nigripes]|nr:hypothetical protein GGS21DRAFT_549024 [Xylaria nigripes]
MDEYPKDDHDGQREPRRRVDRSLGMSEEEHAGRERRRARFLARGRQDEDQHGIKEPSNDTPTVQTNIATDADVMEISQDPPDVVASGQERKPWETLVVGSVGENLSNIERKNREIEQWRFIVQYHEEHSPHQLEHKRRILDRLIRERSEMEDNEENNMPEDQREKGERIASRLDTLRRTIDKSVCEDEKINIRAAIEGYESGRIPYSLNFTLIYAGHVVDTCQSYQEFCQDRSERLDRYFAEYGPGWLWHEPPLAGSGIQALAMKGTCLHRNPLDVYRIGNYKANIEFTIQMDKVSRGFSETSSAEAGNKKRKRRKKKEDADVSCQLETLLDSGATFPIILESDLAMLNVDLSRYSAQGTMKLNIVGGVAELKFYEMYVSVCSDEGTSLVGQGNKAVWPSEPRTLGGFCPVLAQMDPGKKGSNKYLQRLSGMIPFDACYISSAPTMRKLWLGEDRRDVLGTSRLPAHLRFDTDKSFALKYPKEFEALRQDARTPDRVIFVHNFPSKPGSMLTDIDVAGARGRSEMAIGHYLPPRSSRPALPTRVVRIEPRKGGVKNVPKINSRPWEGHYITLP